MLNQKLTQFAASLAVASMLLSPMAMASQPVKAPADVALGDGGVLVGQVMDAQGSAIAKAPVLVAMHGERPIQTETNDKGQFAVKDLRGGVYQVAVAGQQQSYRLWTARTAPPAAQRGVMVVSGQQVVRGNNGNPLTAITNFVAEHPIATAAAIATAVAVPLALDDDDDDNPSS